MASVPKNIYDLVKNEEGFSNKVYSDASGYSVGHGHFLSDDELKLYPPGTTVPQAQLDKWYEEDLDKSYRAAQTQANSLPRFQELDPTQRQAFLERLTSVNFQLGTAWNTKFVDTWKLMQDGDFEAASKEAMDSKWAREQTPTRAAKFSSLLGSLGNSTGQIPGGFTPGQENRGANPLFDLVAPTTRSRTRPSRTRDRTTYTPTTGPVSVGQPIPAGQPAAYNQFDQGMVGSASRLDLSGVLAAKLNETVKYEAAASAARQYRGDTSTTPRYTTGDIWSDSVKAGGEQLTSDVYQFGAIFNLLQGDEEAATAKLNRAERLQQDASLLLNSMGTFEDFLEEPTFEGFFDQVVKSIGQFTPMAISSVGSGFTGAAVAAVGKGVLSATSKRVTREVISDILKKKVAHRKGLGEALDEAEEAILAGAYESVKRMGQYPNFVNLARTGSVPSNFPFISAGFWAGAGGQEYVVGSSQALGEYKEAGYKLTDEEAAAALGLGIPQAIIGTLGEKLFVGALFKRMAGRYAKTGDPEAAGWLMEAAKGFGGGLLKGGLVEGTTEALQEELFIQQRFGIDPNYSDREANLRRAESAFAGFWAGAGRSAPTGAIANVIGKARSYTEEGMDITEEAVIASKRGQSDGRVIPEPKEWSQAQIQALLDEETETKAVWLPTDGLNEADTANTLNDFLQDLVEEGYTPAQIEEKFAMVQDTANNSGFLILDKTNKNFQTDANDAVDSGFSETFLQQILGYTEVSDPSHNAVVQVKDSAGNVVWQQTTSEANVDKVKLHARTRFKNESKYSIEGVTREAAFNERQQAFRGEGFGFTQTQETAPETRTPEAPEGPAPEQGEFDFTERSMETTGQQIDPTLRELGTIKSPTDPATTITQEEADKFSKAGDVIEGGREGFITKPLTKAEQAKMTEQEIVQARANRPIMTWAPRDPATAFEGMTDEEVNAELDKREGLEQDFLDLNGIEENPEVRALLDTLPTSFLETFKAQSRIDPNRMLTPRQNENGEWTMATSPKDVLPGDRINAAERIGDVVTQASRASQALRNKTPGWSVRSPDGRVRDVYMGNLVQFGLDLGLNAPEGYTQGTGRIADGFTRMYEALVENGYELLHEGVTLNESQTWQNAPIYQVKGVETVSFVQAEQGRLITDQEIKVGEKETTTDAARRRELEALDNKVQRAFEEFYADPNRDPNDKFYPPDALSQQESDRKFQLERELNEGFVDRADFVDEVKGTEGEFAPPKVDLDNPLHAPIVTLTEIRTGGSMNDPLGPPRVYPNKGRVQIDASWSSVMGKVWPQLQNILTSRLGYGGRNTEILTKQHIVENGYETDARIMQDGQEYSIAELINESVANMDSLGKYFRFKDTDLIIIDVPANPTVNQQVKSILALGHEIGHAMFHQEMERALNNPKLRNDLITAWEKDRDAGVSEQYKGEFGFEEWYADQMGTWLLAEAKKPTNGVESFFKRLADKIRAVFKSLDGNLRRRFTRNEAFDPYVQDVIKTYKDGNIRNTNMPVSDKVIVRNMLDELGARIKPFMPRKALQQIKRIAIENLEAGKELMPNDKRHWSVAYFLQPAHNYLKKFSPELANAIYSMSQSEEKTGHLNARVLLTYQRLNDLHKIAPTKQTITGKTVPDLDAFETILREAERDVPKEQLSPKAQEVRQFLDDFYENYIRGKDQVFKRDNFYPRIIAIAELQANQQVRDDLVALLKEFNKKGPEDIVVINPNTGQEMSRTPGSFEKVVEAMIREGEDNTDNSRPEVADVAIGTNEARAQYFREIPNERLRDIGALEDANTAIRRYINDMTKRLDYKEKFQTTLTKQDIANIKAQGPAFRQSFTGKKAGDVVDGWQATEIMLQRIPNETDRAAARDAMKAMLGKTGLNMSPAMRKINSVLLSVNIMTYLTFATLASLPDLAGPVLRSKDLSMENLKEGLNQVRRYFTDTKEMQQFARDVGVITFDSLNTSIMQANEMGFMTPTAQKYSDLFFKAIGLEWYTNFTRTFAAGMGEQFLIRQANLNTDRSSRNLRELQVSREDIKVWDQNGRSFSTPEGQRVQMALGRFVEESIVRPNSAERPVWASNPYTALVWQLKSFFYAYGKNVVGGAIRESKNRYSEDGTVSSASVPLVLGALTILPLTMVGLEIREWLKYLGRGGDERAFRSDTMRWGEYSEDIIDRAGILGPFGLIIPILEADQFGKSFWVPPLGPTAERLEDLIRGNAKLSDYMPGYAAVR